MAAHCYQDSRHVARLSGLWPILTSYLTFQIIKPEQWGPWLIIDKADNDGRQHTIWCPRCGLDMLQSLYQVSASIVNPLMGTLKPQSTAPLYSNTVIGTLAVDGWAVTFGTARRDLGGAAVLAVPNVTSPPSWYTGRWWVTHQRPVYQLHIIRRGTIISHICTLKGLCNRNITKMNRSRASIPALKAKANEAKWIQCTLCILAPIICTFWSLLNVHWTTYDRIRPKERFRPILAIFASLTLICDPSRSL